MKWNINMYFNGKKAHRRVQQEQTVKTYRPMETEVPVTFLDRKRSQT